MPEMFEVAAALIYDAHTDTLTPIGATDLAIEAREFAGRLATSDLDRWDDDGGYTKEST